MKIPYTRTLVGESCAHDCCCSALGGESCAERPVADFTLDPGVEGDLDRVLARVAATMSFEPDHHRLDLVGLCVDCS